MLAEAESEHVRELEITLAIEDLTLENTLNSSFSSYLFEKAETSQGTCWIGIAPPIRNIRMTQVGNELRILSQSDISDEILDYVVLHVAGLWTDFPSDILQEMDSESAEVVNRLARLFPGVRVPWLYLNKWQVLISNILSIHARVEMSKMWFASLVNLDPRSISEMNPMELRTLTKNVAGISAGFRARYLIETIRELLGRDPDSDPLEGISRLPHEKARLELCKIRNLGPKVCDCFLLNGLGDLSSPPVDVHVARVSEKLGAVPTGLGRPQPSLCRKFICSRHQTSDNLQLCPKAETTISYLNSLDDSRGTCIRAALTNRFKYAGWIQALLFLFGQTYCVWTPKGRPACDSCPLNDLCSSKDRLKPTIPRIQEVLRRPKSRTRPAAIDQPMKILEYFPEMEVLVKDRANQILKNAGEIQEVRSRVLKGASLWISCRSLEVPILLREVSEAYSVRTKDILRIASMLLEKTSMQSTLAKPNVYIERARRIVGFSADLKELALRLSKRHGSLNPVSQAAAAIYLASSELAENVSQKSLATSLGLTEVTVRNAVLRVERSDVRSGRDR